MWITHLPLACSLQGYHEVIYDNLATEQARLSLHADGGEHGLEVLVTSGSMNVHNSAFFSPLSPSPSHARSCHTSGCEVKSCHVVSWIETSGNAMCL